MDLKLRDRVCLVTGASSGIGRATAILLATEGARVIATARSLAALEPLADAIRADGGVEPVLLMTDLGLDGEVDLLADEMLSRLGHVDVLVNNAGGSRPMTRPDEPAVWAEAFALNFTAAPARRAPHSSDGRADSHQLGWSRNALA